MNVKIGVIFLLLYVVLVVIIYGVFVYNKLLVDMIGGFVVIMIMGIFLGDIGMRILILKNIGGLVIFLLFILLLFVFFNWMNLVLMEVVIMLMKKLNFLYLYIFCLVVGSILGMNCKVLV